MNLRSQTRLENIIYAFIWLVILVLPVFLYQHDGSLDTRALCFYWIRIVPFLVLFALNNYVLIPFFLVRKKMWMYAGTVVVTILVLFTVVPLSMGKHRRMPDFPMEKMEHMKHDFKYMPEPTHDNPPTFPGEDGPQCPPEVHMHPGGPVLRMPVRMAPIVNDWMVAILVVGFNLAIHFLFKSMRDERQIKELESQTLQAELNYLKAQINPHFFMNTLNNIHALVDIDGERAKQTVIELSKIMRYVLYDADQAKVPLSKEIDFLNNYVRLMRIRYTEEVDIQCAYPNVPGDAKIPPLLLMTLIENAFKHGVSYRKDSFIRTNLAIAGGRLRYEVENSIAPQATRNQAGVGLENLRKRLELLYGNDFKLEVVQGSEKYGVFLDIPLS